MKRVIFWTVFLIAMVTSFAKADDDFNKVWVELEFIPIVDLGGKVPSQVIVTTSEGTKILKGLSNDQGKTYYSTDPIHQRVKAKIDTDITVVFPAENYGNVCAAAILKMSCCGMEFKTIVGSPSKSGDIVTCTSSILGDVEVTYAFNLRVTPCDDSRCKSDPTSSSGDGGGPSGGGGGGCSSCMSGAGGSSGMGSANVLPTRAAMNVPLGKDINNYSLGNLVFAKDLNTNGVFDPADFKLENNSFVSTSKVEVGGWTRQVISDEYIVDVVRNSSTNIDVNFYPIAAKGAQNLDGTFSISGASVVQYSFTMLAANTDGIGVLVNKTGPAVVSETWELRGKSDSSVHRSWKSIDTTGKVTLGDELVNAISSTVWERFVSVHRQDAEGHSLSMVFDHYLSGPDGEKLMSRTEGIAHTTQTTTYQYYGYGAVANPFEDNKGKLHSQINPDGSWVKYDYDILGNITNTYRPWVSGASNPSAATLENCHVTMINSSGEKIEKILGTLISTETTYSSANIEVLVPDSMYSVYPELIQGKKVLKTVPLSGSPVSGTELYSGSYYRSYGSDLAVSLSTDGTATYYSEKRGDWNAATGVFVADDFGDDKLRWTMKVAPSATNPNVYEIDPSQPIRTCEVTRNGNLVGSYEQILTAAKTWETTTWTSYTFDSKGRQLTEIKDGDSISSTIYDPSGYGRTTTDQDGVSTYYIESPNGNISTESRLSAGPGSAPEVTTTTTVTDLDDSLGSTPRRSESTTVTTVAGGLTITQMSTTLRDILGRVISSTDAKGRETTYSYNGLVEVETAPGNVVTTTTRHSNGRIASIVSSHRNSQYFTYTVNSNGTITTRVDSGSLPSAKWTTETVDGNDLLRSESRSASTGVFTTDHLYDAYGRLVKFSMGSNLAPVIRMYDTYSNFYRTGKDVNGNGTLDEISNDSLQESLISYNQSGTNWVKVTTSKIWTQTNNVARTTVTKVWLNTGSGSKTEVTDPDGNITTTIVSINNGTRTETTTSSLSSATATNTYVRGRLISSSTLRDSLPTNYGYDGLGRLTSMNQPSSGTLSYVYGLTDSPVEMIDGAGKVTTYTYYPHGHINAGALQSTGLPTGEITYSAYDAVGNLTHQWGGTYPVRYSYNLDGQITEMHTYRSFPTTGLSAALPSQFSAAGDVTTWAYEPQTGLLAQKTDALGKSVTYTYNNEGLLTKRTWARNIDTNYSYNNLGLVTLVNYSDTTPDISRTYDRMGRPLTANGGPEGNRTFSYVGTGTSESYTGGLLGGTTITESQDGHGRATGHTLAIGSNTYVTSYDYDATNRLNQANLSAAGQTIHTSYGYSATRGMLESTATGQTGQPQITTIRNFDAVGRVSSIRTTGAGSSVISGRTYVRDDAGRVIRANLVSGGSWAYNYDDKGQVSGGQRRLPNGNPVHGLASTYDYDGIGNRAEMKSTANPGSAGALTTAYTADAANRYTAMTHPNSKLVIGEAPPSASVEINGAPADRQDQWFAKMISRPGTNPTWAPVDMESTLTGAGPGGSDLTTSSSKYLYLPAASVTPTYDDDGNLLFDGRWNYTWDGEDRLISMETNVASNPGVPRKRIEYQYDSESRRIARAELAWSGTSFTPDPAPVRYIWKGWNLLAEGITSGSTIAVKKSYLWGLDLNETLNQTGNVGNLLAIVDQSGASTVNLLPSYDDNGNIIALSHAGTGQRIASYEYDAFGQQVVSTNHAALLNQSAAISTAVATNRWGFSTKQEDAATGFLYYGYRYYDPETGRWVSRDPIGENGGINLYGFVGNGSIIWVDVLGLSDGSGCDDCDGKSKGAKTQSVSAPYPTDSSGNTAGQYKKEAATRLGVAVGVGAGLGHAGGTLTAPLPASGSGAYADAANAGVAAMGVGGDLSGGTPNYSNIASGLGVAISSYSDFNQSSGYMSVNVHCKECTCCDGWFSGEKSWRIIAKKKYTSKRGRKNWSHSQLEQLKNEAKKLCDAK